jgi:hypothetical protein
MCGDEGIFKISLVNSAEDADLLQFIKLEIGGDISRETTTYYNPKGQAVFAMSVYTHSGAESIYLSRAYYEGGKPLYKPAVEKTSDKSGPVDETPIEQLVHLAAKDAQAHFQTVADMCSK